MSKPLYEVKIDFDEASKAWNMNKVKNGTTYTYCCGHTKTTGKNKGNPCKTPPHHWKFNLRETPFIRSWGNCKRHL